MRKLTLAIATAALVAGIPAAAQTGTMADTDSTVTAVPVEEDDDDDFPWGLLGLIGLAGLLGRKRDDRDRVRRD